MTHHSLLIVGVGSIGERHVRCFSATGRADIRIAETDPELRSRIVDRYSLPAGYDTLRAGLSDRGWQPSVVLIATPAPLHVPMAREVIRHGKHVLIEKPLSTTHEGVEDLMAEVE